MSKDVVKSFDISIKTVIVDSAIQPRAHTLNQDHVEGLREAYASGKEIPPIVVWKLPDGRHKLSQGFHRIEAANRAGLSKITAIIKTGSEKQCLIDAMCSNQGHGLKRTNEDKRRCVTELLKALPESSDRAIAEMSGVDHKTVSKCRSAISQSNEVSGEFPQMNGNNVRVSRQSIEQSNNSSAFKMQMPSQNIGMLADADSSQADDQSEDTSEPAPEPKPKQEPKTRTGRDGVARKIPVRGEPAQQPKPVSVAEQTEVHEEHPYTDDGALRDGLGNIVPDELADVFGDPGLTRCIERIDELHTEAISIGNHIRDTLSKKQHLWPFGHYDAAFKHINQAADEAASALQSLASGKPYCICDRCKGGGCRVCRDSGAINKHRYEFPGQYEA